MDKFEITQEELSILIEAMGMWENLGPKPEELLKCMQIAITNRPNMPSQEEIDGMVKSVHQKVENERRRRVEFSIMLRAKLVRLKDKLAVNNVIQL